MFVDVMAGRPPLSPAPPFGRRLAALRKERGLSQAAFAARVGVSKQMVEYYERRATNPSASFVETAAEALGVNPGALLSDDDDKASAKLGRPSKLDEKLTEARKLPRKKQEQLARMIDIFLEAERRSA